ncbi:hypothetical protein HC891_11725 [Candidatus Gracilibacteria bacterium]|nr:hypothetical protein [Candidatus Gracilibacteria bacterium]
MYGIRSLARIGFALIVAAMLLSFTAVARPVGAQDTALLFAFQGTVRNGPSSSTIISGDLSLTPNADGTLTGALDVGDASIPVTGRLAGANITVTFDLGGGVFVFGIGRADARGNFRGPFVGPASGDFGQWVARPITLASYGFSGTVERGPSTGTTLAGDLDLRIITNRFTGTLTIDENTVIPVEGRISSHEGQFRIKITFDLGDGVTIVGTGRTDAAGVFTGDFRGPQADDRGKWTATPNS